MVRRSRKLCLSCSKIFKSTKCTGVDCKFSPYFEAEEDSGAARFLINSLGLEVFKQKLEKKTLKYIDNRRAIVAWVHYKTVAIQNDPKFVHNEIIRKCTMLNEFANALLSRSAKLLSKEDWIELEAALATLEQSVAAIKNAFSKGKGTDVEVEATSVLHTQAAAGMKELIHDSINAAMLKAVDNIKVVLKDVVISALNESGRVPTSASHAQSFSASGPLSPVPNIVPAPPPVQADPLVAAEDVAAAGNVAVVGNEAPFGWGGHGLRGDRDPEYEPSSAEPSSYGNSSLVDTIDLSSSSAEHSSDADFHL